MIIKPLGNRILIKKTIIEEKTKSGIVLPDTVKKEQPTIGEVVAVGDGEKVNAIKEKERIIYSKYAGTEIENGGEILILLNMDDVLAKIEEKK